MIKERLLERILHLPTIKLGTTVEDDQKIEGNQENVHYRIVKERVLPGSEIIIYSLSTSTSGPERKRKKFVKQIINILGKPFNTEQQFPDDPNFYTF